MSGYRYAFKYEDEMCEIIVYQISKVAKKSPSCNEAR